jgi:hypothetical protein
VRLFDPAHPLLQLGDAFEVSGANFFVSTGDHCFLLIADHLSHPEGLQFLDLRSRR